MRYINMFLVIQLFKYSILKKKLFKYSEHLSDNMCNSVDVWLYV